MPVQYSGIMDEHQAYARRPARSDISHTGQLLAGGSGAKDWLKSSPRPTMWNGWTLFGQCQDTFLLNDSGGVD